jgi:hypothetical protein
MRLKLSKFEYDFIDWSRLPGFSKPITRIMTRFSSHIWRFGVPLEDSDTNSKWWICKECHQNRAKKHHLFKTENGCASARTHCKEYHCKWVDDIGEVMQWRRPNASPLPIDLDTYSARDQEIANALADTFDEETFKDLLLRWMVRNNLPFRKVSSEPFRELIEYLSRRACSCIVECSIQTARSTRRRSIACQGIVAKRG